MLAIEGIGTQNNEVNFIAFAVVNFDPITQKYKLRSYVKEGLFTDAYFKILEDSKFEWGFDIPAGGKTRYTITLNETQRTWQEIGEYSRDGNSWIKFIELNLNKI